MSHRTLKKNILRNLRDQPLHMLWAFASVFAPFAAHHWLNVWSMVAAIVLGLASIAWIIIREWMQYPPHDWWDAPLDWSSYVVGGISGLLVGLVL